MPFATSGFGDGLYPVYELVADGDRVGVEVEFIAAGAPYPFAHTSVEEQNRRVVEDLQQRASVWESGTP
jgi:hypothetical protein